MKNEQIIQQTKLYYKCHRRYRDFCLKDLILDAEKLPISIISLDHSHHHYDWMRGESHAPEVNYFILLCSASFFVCKVEIIILIYHSGEWDQLINRKHLGNINCYVHTKYMHIFIVNANLTLRQTSLWPTGFKHNYLFL